MAELEPVAVAIILPLLPSQPAGVAIKVILKEHLGSKLTVVVAVQPLASVTVTVNSPLPKLSMFALVASLLQV